MGSSSCYNYKMFMCFNRKFKINEVELPDDVKDAFFKYSQGEDILSPDQFYNFLIEHQQEEECSINDAVRVFQDILQRRNHLYQFKNQGLTIDDFFYFLFFDDLNGPIKTEVHHDMTAPLPHYFIYTGHNSYLTGNQLSSDCSDVPIIKALQRGVRVIELDLWPNSSKDDINVLHGRTLTTPVSLLRCLKSIKEYAFVKSPYPLIITLEDHLTPDLQAKVAEMVTQIFGDMLYYSKSDCFQNFPSPEELKYRVILSTKPPKEYLESKIIKEKGNLSPDGILDTSEEEAVTLAELLAYDKIDSAQDDDLNEVKAQQLELKRVNALNSPSSGQDDEVNGFSERKSQHPGAPEYKRLNALHAGKPKNGLRDALKVMTDKVKRLSLSEQALEKAAAFHGTDVVRFTQKNVLRIYPKGTRVNSSNYRPIVGWMHGAQMVAFNMQGYGKSLWLMHGMFRSNGECGYVKKPDLLMTKGPNNEVFDPRKTLPVKTTLKVSVYLGDGWRLDFSQTHFDSYSPPDFYTKVHMFGVPADAAKHRTRIIEDDWNPVWNEEFTFPLTVPELALLRIEVREYDRSDKDDFGGQTCLPVSDLRPGIRFVPLFDKRGDKLKSVRLLMRFEFI
ncbi:unnamed protein product [Rhodiola kirilowii]